MDGAKSGQVYNSLTEEEVFDIIAKETIGVNNNVDISDVECNCQKSQDDTEDNGEQTCNIKNEEEVN